MVHEMKMFDNINIFELKEFGMYPFFLISSVFEIKILTHKYEVLSHKKIK